MGYHTTFHGFFRLDKPLRPEQSAYVRRFAEMSHVPSNEEMLRTVPDPLRTLVGLPLGPAGMYFTGEIDAELEARLRAAEEAGQGGAEKVTFPSQGCQWVPMHGGRGIEWDRGDKFYAPVGWLRFLLEHFLLPWGYHLSGTVQYEGEQGEYGRIVMEQDQVFMVEESDSLVPRQPSKGKEPDIRIYWMTVGAVSEQARKALLEAGCQVFDMHQSPPVVLVGLPYDNNYYRRDGRDDLAIWRTEGILLRSKGLHLEYGELWNDPDERELDPIWEGCVRKTLMMSGEYTFIGKQETCTSDDDTFPPF